MGSWGGSGGWPKSGYSWIGKRSADSEPAPNAAAGLNTNPLWWSGWRYPYYRLPISQTYVTWQKIQKVGFALLNDIAF